MKIRYAVVSDIDCTVIENNKWSCKTSVNMKHEADTSVIGIANNPVNPLRSIVEQIKDTAIFSADIVIHYSDDTWSTPSGIIHGAGDRQIGW